VPEHLAEVTAHKLELLAKTEAAVKDRLTKEITYWDHRAETLKLQEQAGPQGNRPNAKLSSREAPSAPTCSRGYSGNGCTTSSSRPSSRRCRRCCSAAHWCCRWG